MADFGIAHLTFREANVEAARTQSTSWIIAIKLVVKRRACQECGIAVLFALIEPTGIDSPAVANKKQNWLRHSPRSLLMFRAGHKRFPAVAGLTIREGRPYIAS